MDVSFRAMGSQILVTGPRLRSAHGRRAERWFSRWEQQFSRFRPSSELSRLNRRSGRWIRVSHDLFRVVGHARRVARATGGLVSPAVLPALLATGYDRSFDRLPTSVAVRPADAVGDWRLIGLDRGQVRLAGPIDLGGFAKGWVADRVAARLPGPVLVDAGGDIAVSGPLPSGRWPIGIANPHAPDRDLLIIGIEAGGVATSGRDVRRWRQGSADRHHLIDPRTGAPAVTDVLSATVIGPSAAIAEVASKLVLLIGCAAGIPWLDDRGLAGLVVREDGSMTYSAALEAFRWI